MSDALYDVHVGSVGLGVPYTFMAIIIFFFFNDTATTEIYTLSLHDALPISVSPPKEMPHARASTADPRYPRGDRKSTRLNSSHGYISYAVFCLKKKKNILFHAS